MRSPKLTKHQVINGLKIRKIGAAGGYKILLLILLGIPLSCTGQDHGSYLKLFDVDLLNSYINEITFLDSYTMESNGNININSENSDGSSRFIIGDSSSTFLDEVSLRKTSAHEHLNNTLLLITYNTYCGFCISELDFWNEWVTNQDKRAQTVTVKLIIIEESLQNVRNFLQRNSYKILTYHDSAMLMTNWVESYQIPLKVFINADGVVADIRPMGINENLNRYVSSVLN